MPAMSEAARTLLAALFTRMSLTAPDLSWATNGWHNPPDDVPCSFPSQVEVGKALWGAGDYWTLRWSGFPNPEFVSAALTDPVIGLSGARVNEKGNDIVVSYLGAQLRLLELNRHMLGSTPAVLEALNAKRERLFAPR
ncbi:hypothetical protein NE857_21875 [Nocardiopsis exhalans]|uniref:Uncharacterized protein n=1 Tax=Nocardiopsis exhalans TaxID=163604 RepID=A0ABY5D443_9ACTN|nr:hypothetical protein [Nocardiopsis exhalans]USY17967.1 hypothetical protein NE857_21875 [Nocardiopsis exhalans]